MTLKTLLLNRYNNQLPKRNYKTKSGYFKDFETFVLDRALEDISDSLMEFEDKEEKEQAIQMTLERFGTFCKDYDNKLA